VLQRRGLMQQEYQEGTLREKLFGRGHARLLDQHPAVQYRQVWATPSTKGPHPLAGVEGRPAPS